MIYKKTLSRVIGLVTAGLASAAVVPPVTADADEEAVEEIVVTGSRIRTVVSDAPRPVTTLGIEEVRLSGIDNVTDLLRNTTYNSFGSYTASSGSSFGGVALIDLKGMGSDRTAVLVNSRRVPGNPWTGTSAVDINTIPLAAVERVEILTDSASAVYGADAIGGVVNIIMKDDWEGAEIQVSSGRPTRDSANSDSISLTLGTAYDKGSILVSAEWYKKSPIFDSDRDYSNVQVRSTGVPVDGSADVQGINGGGNSAFELDFSEAFQVGPCNQAGLIPVLDPFGFPGTGCGFGFADFSMQNAGVERRAAFMKADYEINDTTEIFLESRIARNETIGRFAPAIGGFLFSEDSSFNTFGRDLRLFHRFVAHGPRDDQGNSDEVDTTIGISGQLFDNSIGYEVYYRDYRFTASDIGKNYIFSSIISDLVASDQYNPVDPFDPANAAAIEQSRATVVRDISTKWEGWGITVDGSFEGINLSGGDIGWAAGLETARESYEDNYDPAREARNIIGSAGNSSAGDRSRTALFTEFQLPIFDNFNVNIAGRYDDYDDLGSEFSPQISANFQATNWLTLRASWGEGFKAPNLIDMYQKAAQDFPSVSDVVRCRAQGIADSNCPNAQIEAFTGGNPDLEAETSESLNLGVIVEPLDGLRLSLDWWNIQMENVVDDLDEADVLELEFAGQLPDGIVVNRAPTVGGVPGAITRCEGSSLAPPACGFINVNANLAERDVEGLDLRFNYLLDTSFGSFTFDASLSKILQFEETLPFFGSVDHAGDEEFPENRVNVTMRYNLESWTFTYMYNWIDETESDVGGKFPSWDGHDINLVWEAPTGTLVSLGVQNLTDEDPSIETELGWNSSSSRVSLELYPIAGRVYTASVRHRF